MKGRCIRANDIPTCALVHVSILKAPHVTFFFLTLMMRVAQAFSFLLILCSFIVIVSGRPAASPPTPPPPPTPPAPSPSTKSYSTLSLHFLSDPRSFWTFCGNVFVNGTTGACNFVDPCLPGVARLAMLENTTSGDFCFYDKEHIPSDCSASCSGLAGNFTVGTVFSLSDFPQFSFLLLG